MPLNRRALLAGSAVLLAGCAPSPVISGAPALPASPPAPQQSAEASAAQAALQGMEAILTRLDGAPYWAEQQWAVAARAQCEVQLARVSAPDPLSDEEQTLFEVAGPAEIAFSDAAAAAAALTQSGADAVAALETAAAAADAGALRLLYASAAAATVALTNTTLVPLAMDAPPRPLPTSPEEGALAVALSHAWALIYGLGVGLGRLGAKDELHSYGTARLSAAKRLRNELRDRLGAAAPAQPAAFDLPNQMTTTDTIRQAWAVLETRLLEGYARVVDASPEPGWRTRLSDQVAPIQAMGGQLGPWPGWVP